ncbi:MAG: MBL fold metallo-hydrolase [Rhodospirillales bacterium]|nr:MBL fold metallo-hydrolase [Rhodospirillales bacterium]
MKYAVIPVTPFVQNCSLVWCPETMKGAVVDPGGDIDRILAAVSDKGVTIEKILLTHGHLDHAGGTADLAERKGVPIEGPHVDDKFWIDGMAQQAMMFGVRGARSFTPDRWLTAGETVGFGKITLEVRHCPGHTPGHVIFFHKPSRLALVGDVLFAGSIGRTDFPKGDHATLIRSIREQLWPLGDDVTFISGHGPISTFGTERRTNPFVADHAATTF